MSYILSGDAAVYYEEYGSGEPLILLPGLLGSLETHWRRFIPEYARHFHVVAADLRGHGRTNNPSRVLRMSQFTDDLHRLVDTLQIERPLLCGYALGGFIALAFALRHPAKVRALVMHGTKVLWTASEAAAWPNLSAVGTAEGTGRMSACAQEHAPGDGPDGRRDLLEAARAFLADLPAEGIGMNDIRAVRCPTLVSVCGQDELALSGEAARIAGALPAGRLQVIDDCAHAIQGMPREPFLTTTIEFLRTCAGDAAR